LVRNGLAELGLDPSAAPQLAGFCDLLEKDALPRGFLGPREADRLVDRHILESAALQRLLPEGPLIDVGSGAGLPGIVLAVLRDGPVTLLEAERRRADFLDHVLEALSIGSRARVVRARAEDAGREPDLREAFNVAVARALAQPPVALEYCLPFVRPSGMCALHVGPGVDLAAAARASLELGGGEPELVELQVPGLDTGRGAMIVAKVGVVGERYPRRTGVPARRPLG
jgi:16S rRNA (guanine(527)-N(7))-methyltransferase RsmG